MANFHVIALDTGLPVTNANGDAIVYADGRAAAMQAKEHTERTGKKHQPRPVIDDNWQERERKRFEDGTYTPLPWDILRHPDYAWARANERDLEYQRRTDWFLNPGDDTATAAIAHHFPHVSTKVPGNIAFTESPEKGAADVQTSMKPGRYLTKFYGQVLCEESIRAYACEFIARYGSVGLKFATTADDIERVYVNGPNSCMSHKGEEYASDVHPVRVYAAGDLQLAYLSSEDDEEEHITARVLVWPARKLFGRIYGDEHKLRPLLEAQGYSKGSLRGAKLLRIEQDDDNLVLPYIDYEYRASDHGTYLTIDPHGDIIADNTNGLSRRAPPCPHCGNGMDEEESYYIADIDERWCDRCVGDGDAFYCAETGDYYTTESAVTMHDGAIVSQAWFDRRGFTCDGNGNNYRNHDAIHMANGETWSREYFEDNGFVCDETGEHHPLDNAVTLADGRTVSREWSEENPQTATEDDADPMAPKPHAVRQRRDDHPDQIEMHLPRPRPLVESVRVGDFVTLKDNDERDWVPAGVYEVVGVQSYTRSDRLLSRLLRVMCNRGYPWWIANDWVIAHTPVARLSDILPAMPEVA